MHKVGQLGQIRGLRFGRTGHIHVASPSSLHVVVHRGRIVLPDHFIRSLVFEDGNAREQHDKRQHGQEGDRGHIIGRNGDGGDQRQSSHHSQRRGGVE